MKILKKSFQLLKSNYRVLVPFFVLWSWSEALLTRFIQSQIGSHEGAPLWIWGFVILSVFLSAVGPLFLGFWIFVAPDKGGRDWSRFLQAWAEQIRATGSVLLWTLAFLLPGLLRFLQLSFVSWVSLLDEGYLAGDKDALESSRKIFQKCWWQTLLLIGFFSVLIPVSLTLLDEWMTLDDWFYASPLLALPLLGVELWLALWALLAFHSLWIRHKESTREPVFQS